MGNFPLREITEADVEELKKFIKQCVSDSGQKGVVVGISGGVDSAVVAKLSADALGGKNVLAIFMPTSVTPPEDYIITKKMCKDWGIRYKTLSIQQPVDVFQGILLSGKKEVPLEKGNLMARCRMIVLYDNAKKEKSLVAGTTNRSEYLMGYMTKFGDGAEDIMPMCGLYKTQVWEIAKLIGVPKEVIDKVPTAGLWEGQSDEEEMGISYHNLDLVLNAIEAGAEDEEISAAGNISLDKVKEIKNRIKQMKHKRSPVTVPEGTMPKC